MTETFCLGGLATELGHMLTVEHGAAIKRRQAPCALIGDDLQNEIKSAQRPVQYASMILFVEKKKKEYNMYICSCIHKFCPKESPRT